MEKGLTADSIGRLIDELNKLPGIGPKTAQRLTYHLIRATTTEARALAQAILDVKEKVVLCSSCQNITDTDPCPLCQDQRRDRSTLCVVEDPLDVMALERTRVYRGLYHVLHGVLSPLNGVGPEDLKLQELVERVRGGEAREVILATNPTLEGEATAAYIQRLLADARVKVTRLARGLPTGGDLEYADEVTLTRALEGRREM